MAQGTAFTFREHPRAFHLGAAFKLLPKTWWRHHVGAIEYSTLSRQILTAFWVVVLLIAIAIGDAKQPAVLQHVNRETVVIHASRFGVDAGEPGAAAPVRLILTRALAAIAPIVAWWMNG